MQAVGGLTCRSRRRHHRPTKLQDALSEQDDIDTLDFLTDSLGGRDLAEDLTVLRTWTSVVSATASLNDGKADCVVIQDRIASFHRFHGVVQGGAAFNMHYIKRLDSTLDK